MLKLESNEYFRIANRNWLVFTMAAPFEMNREKPEIVGQTVSITCDGEVHEGVVTGVEKHPLAPGIPIRKGEPIGLALEISK